MEKIRKIENYSILCAQIINLTISKILMPKYSFLKLSNVNYDPLLIAVFKPENSKFFQNLIENYLFKY